LPINLVSLYSFQSRFSARTERPCSSRKKGNPVRIGNYPRNCDWKNKSNSHWKQLESMFLGRRFHSLSWVRRPALIYPSRLFEANSDWNQQLAVMPSSVLLRLLIIDFLS